MEKQLNLEALQKRCEERGMSQSDIAQALGLTRAAVSKWFNGKSFPRPAELLNLGQLLGLRHHELVNQLQAVEEPLVAFRARAHCKTTDRHFDRAREMGYSLRPLVKYLDFDPFVGPPSLKNPNTDYRYLQDLVAKLRRELDVAEDAPVHFKKLVRLFDQYQAVIIPTLWGPKTRQENALHIHLPDSQTTWVYLNLDVEIHDFKFWMLHELGHVLTLDLLREGRPDDAEDFADPFAAAFLFPEAAAEDAYTEYGKARSDRSRLNVLCSLAEKHTISPNTVYREVRSYVKACGEPFAEIDGSKLHSAITRFNQRFPLFSQVLFDDAPPSADQFMRVAQEEFGTTFFKPFAAYVREKRPSLSNIATILGVTPMDASAYLDALAR